MAGIETVKIDMSDLVSALQKFMEWQTEYADIQAHRQAIDSAGILMDILGIQSSDVHVLIGGSDAPIFRRAAMEIASLRQALQHANNFGGQMRADADELRQLLNATVMGDTLPDMTARLNKAM